MSVFRAGIHLCAFALGFALMAWITDPHKNALAIMQLR